MRSGKKKTEKKLTFPSWQGFFDGLSLPEPLAFMLLWRRNPEFRVWATGFGLPLIRDEA